MTFDGLIFRSVFYCWGEFLKYFAGVFTFLFISKIRPNTKTGDRNQSPSKVVTLLCKEFMTLSFYLDFLPFFSIFHQKRLKLFFFPFIQVEK